MQKERLRDHGEKAVERRSNHNLKLPKECL